MKFWRMAVGALLVLAFHPRDARAEFPDRTIRLVVPFAPGGAQATSSQGCCPTSFRRILGQTVVVENRPGGGTVIGTQAVATATPDGYTLLLISPAHTINPYINKSLPYQTLTDFTPISQVTRSAYVLVTAAQSRFKTVRDFAAQGQQPVSFASAARAARRIWPDSFS